MPNHGTKWKSGYSIFFLIIGLFLCLFYSEPAVSATDQNTVSETPAETLLAAPEKANGMGAAITAQRVRDIKTSITDSRDLADETKTKLQDTYDKVLEQFKQIDEYRAQIETYRQMQQTAPASIQETQAALEPPPAEPTTPNTSGMALADMEKELAAAQKGYDDAKKTSSRLEQEPNRRAERRIKIPEELNAAREELNQIKAQAAAPPAGADYLNPARAATVYQQVRSQALQLKIESLQEEEKAYTATEKLLAMQRDLASRKLTSAEKQLKFWDQTVRQTRQKEAQQLQAKTEKEVRKTEFSNEAVRQLAQENAELARLQAERIVQMEKANQDAAGLETQLTNLKNDFENVKLQVNRAGKVTSALGVLLLTKKRDLPDIRDDEKKIRERMTLSSLAQMEWYKYDKQWSDLTDPESYAKQLLDQSSLPETDPSYSEILQKCVQLLQEQRQILRKLTDYTMDYITALTQLDLQERALVSTVRQYEQFIEENIFWVKNIPALDLKDLTAVFPAAMDLFGPARWKQTGAALWHDLKTEYDIYGFFLVALFVLVRFRPWMVRKLREMAEKVRHVYSDQYRYTMYSLGLTFLIVLPWPLLTGFSAWRLFDSSSLYPACHPLALALYYTTSRLWVYKSLRWFCAQGGLGEHFRLSREFLNVFRRHTTWLFRILIPLTFFYYLYQDSAIDETVRNSVLRFLFLGRHLLLMTFLLVVLKPSGILIGPYLKKDSWLDNLKYVWYNLCWILPLALCYLAIIGYGYTAHQLHYRLIYTLLLVLAVFFFNGMLVRWLYVAQTKLALKQRREEAEQQRQERLAEADKSDVKEGVSDAEPKEDLIVHISRQTRRLINALSVLMILVGIFWIWKSIMPALGALEEIKLWETADAQGQPIIISLGGLFDALVILIMTIIVTRNVPGFLEVSVLQRAPFDTGVRFAITSLTRYSLFMIGIIAVCAQLGLRWSTVQWLIAAIGVGLGFGLQEIFANFISGLILLFERPIRVGDVVTIGEITGKVTRIQIRATTIQLWDRKELVVPNREFITGRLVNWTLSDTVLRLDFPVGVAYGSDIRKTEATLYEVAANHPRVIKDDPQPKVIFRGFGDSSLQFELRLHIASMDYYFTVWHEINMAIDDAFRRQQIEIAFPQRDLHIRSIKVPLPIRQEDEKSP